MKSNDDIPKKKLKWYEKHTNIAVMVGAIILLMVSCPDDNKDSAVVSKESQPKTTSDDGYTYDANGNLIINKKPTLTKAQSDSIEEVERSSMLVRAEKERKRRNIKKIKDDCVFNTYDGSFYMLNRYVKDRMNDPDSFEHIQTRYVEYDDYIQAYVSFRGRNGFGALVKSAYTFNLYSDCRIVMVE
ncbi:hypothetical protein [Reichenbachiella sp.]|uniref:hypothetical protein n=1 Tax=Reichenbachiella sp. TaxID=2184521 RepID=UPI003297CD94